MSNTVLNDSVQFFSYNYTRQIVGLNNTVFKSVQRVAQVIQHETHDYRLYTINLATFTKPYASTFIDFYLDHLGNNDSFLFKDITDFEVPRNSIGTGDGAEADYQLIEVKGTQTFNRWNIIAASVSIWVNNALKTEGGGSDYTLDYTDSGIVTFNGGSIPGSGEDVEAKFDYYRRCRFVEQIEDVENAFDNVSIQIQFEEERPSGV